MAPDCTSSQTLGCGLLLKAWAFDAVHLRHVAEDRSTQDRGSHGHEGEAPGRSTFLFQLRERLWGWHNRKLLDSAMPKPLSLSCRLQEQLKPAPFAPTSRAVHREAQESRKPLKTSGYVKATEKPMLSQASITSASETRIRNSAQHRR